MTAASDNTWSSDDTTPEEIDAALRRLIAERHGENASYVPGRVLNMVCIVDAEAAEEVAERLRGVGRYHASRTVVCSVTAGRRRLAARASVSSDGEPADGQFAVLRESIVVEVGSEHLNHLDSIVDPLVVTDLATVVWAPHGHHDAIDALLGIAQIVLLDSVDEPAAAEALRRACALSQRVYVVDLAWLRSTPWRERIAAAFDPPERRPQLDQIASVEIRHHPDSAAAALLLSGWLASRLGWEPARLSRHDSTLAGRLRASDREVAITLVPRDLDVRGLAGITIGLADDSSLSLDRGAGGLRAVRRGADGSELGWTVVGASRGEGGILGEGIRQALLRDPSFRAALSAAGTLAASEL